MTCYKQIKFNVSFKKKTWMPTKTVTEGITGEVSVMVTHEELWRTQIYFIKPSHDEESFFSFDHLRFVVIRLIGGGGQNSGPATLSSSPECANMSYCMARGNDNSKQN